MKYKDRGESPFPSCENPKYYHNEKYTQLITKAITNKALIIKIATTYNLPIKTVRQRVAAKKHSLHIKSSSINDDIAMMITLWSGGMPYMQLSEKFGYSEHYIKQTITQTINLAAREGRLKVEFTND